MVAVAVDIGANQTTCTKVIIEVAIAIVAQYDKVQSESEIRASRDQDLSIGLNLDAFSLRLRVWAADCSCDLAGPSNAKTGVQRAVGVKTRQRKKPGAGNRSRPHCNDLSITLHRNPAAHIAAAAKVGDRLACAVKRRVERTIGVVAHDGKVVVATIVGVADRHQLAVTLQRHAIRTVVPCTHRRHHLPTHAKARVQITGRRANREAGERDGSD